MCLSVAGQALGITLLEMATGARAPAEGEEYHNLREGRAPMPGELTPEFQELLKAMLHMDASLRPHAREIVRHPLLTGLLHVESIACLRSQPPDNPNDGIRAHTLQKTGADLMDSTVQPEVVASVQSRAVKAESRALKTEKEAARLRAALQAAQQEAAMLRDRVKLLEQSGAVLQDHRTVAPTPLCAHKSSPQANQTCAASSQPLPNCLFEPAQSNKGILSQTAAGTPVHAHSDFKSIGDGFVVPSARKDGRAGEARCEAFGDSAMAT